MENMNNIEIAKELNRTTNSIAGFFRNHKIKRTVNCMKGRRVSEETKRINNNKYLEENTINHYSKYGFKTLIIWEDELEDQDKILEKIENFQDNSNGNEDIDYEHFKGIAIGSNYT